MWLNVTDASKKEFICEAKSKNVLSATSGNIRPPDGKPPAAIGRECKFDGCNSPGGNEAKFPYYPS